MPVLTVLGGLDITVQNLYAPHKSPLPRSYATFPSVRELVRVITIWARHERPIGTSTGHLSAHAWKRLVQSMANVTMCSALDLIESCSRQMQPTLSPLL